MKNVKLSHLIKVFQTICQLSFISRSKTSSSWDFDLSLPFLEENMLRQNITFVSRRTFKNLPLNSERHIYEMNDIVIRNLQIDLDNRSGWIDHHDWEPLSHAKWHFVNCHFEPSSPNMWTIHFPWCGSFRFYNNKFEFESSRFGGSWLFVFQYGSRILFQGNAFKGSSIQTRCIPPVMDRDDPDETISGTHRSGSISLVGNKGIRDLGILEGYSSVAVTGMNRIDRLTFEQLPDANQGKIEIIYLGPREKIDRDFHHCLHHRSLFLSLRHLAGMNHDAHQVNVLDKQLDRIEYFFNKEQDTPFLLDNRIWIEYWQDRVLYAWRRWSSDFYKSWLRPLSMIVLGYMLLNAIPALFIEAFSLSHWIEFTLRPISDIAGYEKTLNKMFGSEYDKISSSGKNALRFFGLVEVIWIAIWSFAFARSIKR